MFSQRRDMSYWQQISAALTVSLVWMSLGTLVGFSTIALPEMQAASNTIKPNTLAVNNIYENQNLTQTRSNETKIDDIHIDEELGSWFAAAYLMSGIPMTPLGGYIGGLIGRRKIILLTHPGALTGWIIMATSENIPMLFFGRMLTAISICLHISSVGVYIAESAHPKIRNNLTILPSMFFRLGTWFVWTIGYFLSWRNTALLCMVPNILVILCLIPLPESPYWLIEFGKKNLAEKSLQFFRGPDYDITEEINEIKEKQLFKVEQKEDDNKMSSMTWIFKQLTSSSFLKPYSCVGVLYIAVEWSGFSAFASYMIQILKESRSTLDPNLGPVLIGSVTLFFTGIVPFIVGKFKPKVLFVICQSITLVSIIMIGIYVYLKKMYEHSGVDPESKLLEELPIVYQYLKSLGWIPIVFIGLLIVVRGIGIMPVLHILFNEMFPTDIRTLSIGISQSMYLLSGCISVKSFPALLDLIGLEGICLLYALISGFCLIWAAITIPDNRGKTLTKIEESTSVTRPVFKRCISYDS